MPSHTFFSPESLETQSSTKMNIENSLIKSSRTNSVPDWIFHATFPKNEISVKYITFFCFAHRFLYSRWTITMYTCTEHSVSNGPGVECFLSSKVYFLISPI